MIDDLEDHVPSLPGPAADVFQHEQPVGEQDAEAHPVRYNQMGARTSQRTQSSVASARAIP